MPVINRSMRLCVLGCLTLYGQLVSAQATVTDAASGPQTSLQRQAPRNVAGRIDQRVDAFTKALQLDVTQQGQLRGILSRQRDAVLRIWNDHTLAPVERAPATRAVNERAADEIRAMLNDEQKAKYNAAKSSKPQDSADMHTVEQWMDSSRQK